MTETWIPVVGYEANYEVSSLGRVRSVERTVSNGVGLRRVRSRVLEQWHRPDGRLSVNLSLENRQRTTLVHHLVLEAFVGGRPENMEGCHNNGNPIDNRITNLRWDTHAANIADAVQHGTHPGTRKTHCKRGHLLAAPNLKPADAEKGRRSCLACAREYAHARGQLRVFDPALADERYRLLQAARR